MEFVSNVSVPSPTSAGHAVPRSWTDAVAGPRVLTGGWLTGAVNSDTSTTEAGNNANELQLAPITLTYEYSIDRIQWEVATVSGAGGLYDLCLYASVDGIPDGQPIWNWWGIDGTNGGLFIDSPSLTLGPGLYWTGYRRNAAASGIAMRAIRSSALPVLDVSSSFGAFECVWTTSSTQGSSFPTIDSTAWAAGNFIYNNHPLLGLRVG